MFTGFPFLLLTHKNKMVAAQFLSVSALFRSQFVAKPYVDLKNYKYDHYIVVNLIFSKVVAVGRFLISNVNLTNWPQTSKLLKLFKGSSE